MQLAPAVRRLAVAVMAAAALSLAACGTTVQTRPTATGPVGSDPLGAPAEIGADLPGAELGDATVPPAPGAVRASAAGSSGSGGDNRSATVTATAAPGGAPVSRGVDRRPIDVGILYTNNDAAAGFGVDNGNTFAPRKVFEGLVTAWNSRGGVAGRRIQPVYFELRSSSQSISSDLQAACSRFTEDSHVAVVLSSVGLYFESFAQCIAKAGVPLITGDYALGDDVALRAATSYFATTTVSTDARMRVLLEQVVAAGRLRSSDKLGVVVEGCPFNERTYERTVVPVARQLGVIIDDHVVGRCFESINDFGGLASDMQNAVLRFASRGVTHVTFVSGGAEGNLVLLFATAAEAQGFRPAYTITSAAAATVQEQNTPPAQLAGATGLGWLPSLDTTRSAGMTTPAQRQCLADLETGAGAVPQSPADRYFAFSICDTFSLTDAALRQSRGATGMREMAAAVGSLGARHAGAAPYAGHTDYSAGRRTAPYTGRLFAWSTECDCFDYIGAPFRLLPR